MAVLQENGAPCRRQGGEEITDKTPAEGSNLANNYSGHKKATVLKTENLLSG